MKPESWSDERLMEQVVRGNRDLLEVIVRRHAIALLAFIRRLVGDSHRAEELFQEVFLTVWAKRRLYDPDRPFKPWLYAVALNRCRAALRSPAASAVLRLATPEDSDHPAGPDPLPEQSAIAGETTRLVLAAIDRLPPQQRAVVLLRVWEEMPYAEIARVVGRTEATVRSHMHHGLAALRRDLEPRLR